VFSELTLTLCQSRIWEYNTSNGEAGGRAMPSTVRTINWAWRTAFDVCAPKAINTLTYRLYASPRRTEVLSYLTDDSVVWDGGI
jgi:hypothetical protein